MGIFPTKSFGYYCISQCHCYTNHRCDKYPRSFLELSDYVVDGYAHEVRISIRRQKNEKYDPQSHYKDYLIYDMLPDEFLKFSEEVAAWAERIKQNKPIKEYKWNGEDVQTD